MGAHNTAHKLFNSAILMKDPGASGTIVVDRTPVTVQLISATAETRTLRRPSRAGLTAKIGFKTDGGDITLTVTGGYDEDGSTSITFNEAGQYAVFESFHDGSNGYWRMTAFEGAGGGGLNAEILTVATTLTVADHGKTFFLNHADGFAVTLPALTLGFKVRFVVMTSPTTAYTIVTASAANNLCGQVLTLDVNSATDPDFTATADQDTVTLVASKAVKGDWVELECDGTSWYARASASVFDGITIDQAG